MDSARQATDRNEEPQSLGWRLFLMPGGCLLGGFVGLCGVGALCGLCIEIFAGAQLGALIGAILGWWVGHGFDDQGRLQFSLRQLLCFALGGGLFLFVLHRLLPLFLKRL